MEKYKELQKSFVNVDYALKMESLMDHLLSNNKKYKTCFLVRQKDQLIPVQQKQIGYFFIPTEWYVSHKTMASSS